MEDLELILMFICWYRATGKGSEKNFPRGVTVIKSDRCFNSSFLHLKQKNNAIDWS